MDVLQKIHKKFEQQNKKINGRLAKCYLLSKARSLHHSAHQPPVPPTKPLNNDESDSLVVVARPPPDVRLVLFTERGDTCQRNNVFDSKSVQKVVLPKKKFSCHESVDQSQSNVKKTQIEYQSTRSPSDWKVLSEMLFGSVGMAQKAASLKIHYMNNPPTVSPTVMLSRVFCLPSFKENTTVSLDRGMESVFEMQRANSILSRRKANTMPVPYSPTITTPPSSVSSSSFSSHSNFLPRSDSSASISSLLSNSSQGNSSFYTGSLGTGSIRIPASSHGRAHSLPKNPRDSFTLIEEMPYSDKVNSAIRRTRMKIGFAVLCQPEPSNAGAFQQFFFEHFPIIESHMTSLKGDIEKALNIRSRSGFLEHMMKALDSFTTKLHVIYSTPRLPEPVWSTLNPSPAASQRSVVVQTFIADIERLVTECNTKQKNFFFSGLLTAVLTYHLGWVDSATPNKNHRNISAQENYNVLWAQLGDLYGAVGSPTKTCRTVVSGSVHEFVSTLLSVLSYFIRSARVEEVVPVPDRITPVSLGVQKAPPEKALHVSLVPCDLEDEYVLVSVKNADATDAPEIPSNPAQDEEATNSAQRSAVSRSKSSPVKNYSPSSSLSRSYSGPMFKGGSRQRSNALVDSSARHRTFSNNVLKPKVVQSRRKSHDTTDVAMPTKTTLHKSFSSTSDRAKATSTKSLNIHGSFCMKQDVKIEWPTIPTHDPGCDSLGSDKSKKMSTSLQNLSSGKNDAADVCKLEPSFVDRIQPPIARVVNVQRACPVTEARENMLASPMSLPGAQVKKNLTSEPILTSLCNEVSKEANSNSNHLNAEKQPQKLPSRSLSNPSVCAKDSVNKKHRRTASNTKVRVRVGTRRHQLPTSPLTPECVTNADRDSTAENPEKSNSESPSFQRIKLLRIPSVEMNHNVFDEYFDQAAQTNSNNNEASGNRPQFGDSSPCLDKIDEQTNNSTTKPAHHVVSCPNFSAASTPTQPPSQGVESEIDISKTPTPSSESVPQLYPDLPAANIPTPVPPPRRLSAGPNPKRIYPPLPSKPPVGAVSFNVGKETVSFNPRHSKARTAVVAKQEEAPPKPLPRRQSSTRSDVTISQDKPLKRLKELPLADIDCPIPAEKTSEPVTGFASLMADYNQEYLNDFILHGTQNDPGIHRKILNDLSHAVRNPTLDEPIAEAVCILADTDSWSVKVYSSQRLRSDRPCLPALTSKLVSGILFRVAQMHRMKMSPEFCLNHLESELRQLVLKSRMLAQYARGHKRVTMDQLSAALSIESQDLPLLMAIASCHSPHVAPMML